MESEGNNIPPEARRFTAPDNVEGAPEKSGEQQETLDLNIMDDAAMQARAKQIADDFHERMHGSALDTAFASDQVLKEASYMLHATQDQPARSPFEYQWLSPAAEDTLIEGARQLAVDFLNAQRTEANAAVIDEKIKHIQG